MKKTNFLLNLMLLFFVISCNEGINEIESNETDLYLKGIETAVCPGYSGFSTSLSPGSILRVGQAYTISFSINGWSENCSAGWVSDGTYNFYLTQGSVGSYSNVVLLASGLTMSNGSISYTLNNWTVPSISSASNYNFTFKRTSDQYALPFTSYTITNAYDWDFDGNDNPIFAGWTNGNSTVNKTSPYSVRLLAGSSYASVTNTITSVSQGTPLSLRCFIKTGVPVGSGDGGHGFAELWIGSTLIASLDVQESASWVEKTWSGTAPVSGEVKIKIYEDGSDDYAYFDDIRLTVN